MAVTIIPGEGQAKFIAQDLLFLADHPRDVESVSRPQVGFRVSDELFERFEAFQGRDVVEAMTPAVEETKDEDQAPPVPRRGRPKKKVEDQ